MSDDADADALTQLYDAIFDSYASTFSSLRAQIADETGINGIAIRLTALNPDGTVLYSPGTLPNSLPLFVVGFPVHDAVAAGRSAPRENSTRISLARKRHSGKRELKLRRRKQLF